MIEARYWEKYKNKVHCLLCPVNCIIPKGEFGFCRIRKNVDGKLYAIYYGKITSLALDPIEKKPLNRFYPGSKIISLGGYSCNMRCPFCQNYGISMELPVITSFEPKKIVGIAEEFKKDGNIGVAYTYNEPFINYEYLYDCSKLIKKAGMKNVIVTNGYVNTEPLLEILPLIDAMNIDLKGISEIYYKKLGGKLKSVKSTIETASKSCHVELTTLIIPGENDSDEEMKELSSYIASINNEIPLHISRFYPTYKMTDKLPTPSETIHRLVEIARKNLKYVYAGNI